MKAKVVTLIRLEADDNTELNFNRIDEIRKYWAAGCISNRRIIDYYRNVAKVRKILGVKEC